MSIYRLITGLLFLAFSLMATQSIGQRHSSVKKGTDDNARVEQVFDDISTMEQVIAFYEIEESRLQTNLENYRFWVSFIRDNRMSGKRKKMITEFLGTMKRELAQ